MRTRTRTRLDLDDLMRQLMLVGFGMLLAWSMTGVVGMISGSFTIEPNAALRFLLAILVVVFARRTYWEFREWHWRRTTPGRPLRVRLAAVGDAAPQPRAPVTGSAHRGHGNDRRPEVGWTQPRPDAAYAAPMPNLRDFERRLGGLVEGLFSKTFRSGLQPVEIAKRIVRSMDERKQVGVNEVWAPNRFEVSLSERRRAPLHPHRDTARQRAHASRPRHRRRARVGPRGTPAGRSCYVDEQLRRGDLDVEASLVEGEETVAPVAAVVLAAAGARRRHRERGAAAARRRPSRSAACPSATSSWTTAAPRAATRRSGWTAARRCSPTSAPRTARS